MHIFQHTVSLELPHIHLTTLISARGSATLHKVMHIHICKTSNTVSQCVYLQGCVVITALRVMHIHICKTSNTVSQSMYLQGCAVIATLRVFDEVVEIVQ